MSVALDGVSVGSDCHLRGIEAFETWNVGVGFHGANRSEHALSLQVLFSALPHGLSDSWSCPRHIAGFGPDRPPRYVVSMPGLNCETSLVREAGWYVREWAVIHDGQIECGKPRFNKTWRHTLLNAQG